MSGSDVDGSWFEDGAGNDGESRANEWNIQIDRRKRKKKRQETSQSEVTDEHSEKEPDEFKVVLTLCKEGASFGKWNPIQLTREINKVIGNVKCAKTLRNGSLLVICKTEVEKEKALKVKRILGESVIGKMLERKQFMCGVISGISPRVPAEEIKANLRGGKIVEVRRLKAVRNGERTDSFSIMIKFDEKVLPDKVFIDCMCYDVRVYIPPPLRCFKCQKFGHVAAMCRGKQRCGRCAGEHEYGNCAEGARIKCCNCGGEHTSAYRGCEISKRAAEVQKVKVTTGVTYAEAARKLPAVPRKAAAAGPISNPTCTSCSNITEDTLMMKKDSFLLFMAEVINCTVQAKGKTEKIMIIVNAAEKHLGISNIKWESINEKLMAKAKKTQSQQSQQWSGTPLSGC